MEYDVIGDIHGEADALEALLARLGYRSTGSLWVPPAGRQAVFLGDLIDRGPEQLKVIDAVRRMVDAGHARCLMGNHELNAIGWITPREDGNGFLRPHTPSKTRQHERFLAQVGEGSSRHRELVDWFRTLPVALYLSGIRAVHAWWHDGHVDLVRRLQGDRPLNGQLLQDAFDEGSPTWAAYDGLSKGYELDLPHDAHFEDKDGNRRHAVRTQWWNDQGSTYREIAVIDDEQRERIPELPLPDHFTPTPVAGSPVFVGHYWLKGEIGRRNAKLACLDFSVAAGGPLVAYRWRGEDEIDDANFVWAR